MPILARRTESRPSYGMSVGRAAWRETSNPVRVWPGRGNRSSPPSSNPTCRIRTQSSRNATSLFEGGSHPVSMFPFPPSLVFERVHSTLFVSHDVSPTPFYPIQSIDKYAKVADRFIQFALAATDVAITEDPNHRHRTLFSSTQLEAIDKFRQIISSSSPPPPQPFIDHTQCLRSTLHKVFKSLFCYRETCHKPDIDFVIIRFLCYASLENKRWLPTFKVTKFIAALQFTVTS